MADIKWVKISTNIFGGNRKITQIEKMAQGDTILVIWFKLIILAGIINDGGAIYVTKDIPYTEEALADELGRKLPIVKKALSEFKKYGMIEVDGKGIIYLASWEKYQNIDGLDKVREQTRNRVSKCREKKRSQCVTEETCNVTRNVTCNATVTQCNAIEEEGEKDIHSFYLSYDAGAGVRVREGDAGDADNLTDRERVKQKYLGGELGRGVVMLSDEQFDDLLDKLSIDEFNKYVEIVANCELSGQKYKKKTHYRAILDMAKADRKVLGG